MPLANGGSALVAAVTVDGNVERPIDSVLVTAIRRSLSTGWAPMWKERALSANRADMHWAWREVLKPETTFPGRVDPLPGALVAFVSARRGLLLEGLLRVAFRVPSFGLTDRQGSRRRPLRRPLVLYVDTLAAAPWNRAEIEGAPPRIEGIGRALLAFAIHLSRANGTGGRLSLHPAPDVVDWYGRALPGSLWFRDGREHGLEPDPETPDDPYMELSDEASREYLDRYRAPPGMEIASAP